MSSFLDIRTLALTTSLLSITLALCMFLIMKGKKIYPGFDLYTLALICLFVGQALLGARGYLHDIFSVILGNAALLGFFAMIYDGMVIFLDRKASRLHYLFPATVAAGPFMLFTFLWPDVNARIIIFSLVSLAYCGAFLRLLFGEVRRQFGLNWILTCAVVCAVLVSLLRLGNALFIRAPLTDLFSGGILDAVIFIAEIPMVMGAVLGLIGLTFQKTEKARQESEAFSRSVFDAAPDAILVADTEGRFFEANPAACALYGYSRDQILGMSAADFGGKSYSEELSGKNRFPAEGSIEATLRGRDGKDLALELAFARVSYAGKAAVMSSARDVSPRRAAELSLRASEQRYRSLVATVSDIIWEVDLQGRYKYISQKVKDLLGYEPDDVIGHTLFEFMSEEEVLLTRKQLEEFVADPRPFSGLLSKSRSSDGSMVVLESSGVPAFGPEGSLEGFWVCTRDVTARTRAQETIRYHADLLDRISDAIISTDAQFRILSWNRAAEAIFGWTADEVMGKTSPELLRTEYGSLTREQMLATLRANGFWGGEVIQYAKSGAPVDIYENVTPLLDPAGTFNGMVSVNRDIAGRKRAEEALRASEMRLRTIFEASMAGIVLLNTEGTITFANQRMADMFKCPLEKLVGSDYYDHVHPQDDNSSRQALEALLAGEADSLSAERRYICADGSEFWGIVSSRRIMDPNGRLTSVISSVTDFTELRNAEEALRRSEEHHRSTFVNAPFGIVRSTAEGRLIAANPAFARILGYESPDDLLDAMEGRGMGQVVYESPVERQRIVETVLNKGGWQHFAEIHMRRRNGTIAITNISSRLDVSSRGAVVELESFVEDITERKRAEEEREKLQAQFQQAQKMEAVGRLAGGIAHDFNNLLTVILGYCDLSMDRTLNEDPSRRYLAGISDAARRATGLTSQLLAFSRKQILQPKLIDLDDLLSRMADMLRRLIGEDIELRVLRTRDLWRVNADPGQIEQVVMNLAVNARDAMPDGGTLTLETANVGLDASYTREHVEAKEGSYVLLAVSDSGQGMDAATMAKIFEPFFTTKEVGKGTGLGLATVYGIIKQSGGNVACYSEPGRGTTFKVFLPKAPEGVGKEGMRAGSEAPVMGGSETILLVEDDDMVRRLAELLLEEAGYTVLPARGGSEAILLLADSRTAPSLLITDVVMPGMDGRKVAQEITSRCPGLPVLYLSGYTEDAIVHRGVLDPGVQFLPKPYTKETLLRKVRELIDERSHF